jgi:glutathione S-transferase
MTANYTLYYAPGSASLAVHWLLLELGVPFTAVPIDLQAGEHKQAQYLAINPLGLVPSLIVDGKPQAECAALLLLLAERHPLSAMAPALSDPARADSIHKTPQAPHRMPLYKHWQRRVSKRLGIDWMRT